MALHQIVQKWRDRFGPLISRGAVPQYGVMPYTIVDGQALFLLVTSRRTGRWIFPKGGAIEGMTPREVAALEGFEEAGIEGEVEPSPIGVYRSTKTVGMRNVVIQVELYPLRLTRQFDDWPEMNHRERRWVVRAAAIALLSNARLVELVTRLDRRIARDMQPATAPSGP